MCYSERIMGVEIATQARLSALRKLRESRQQSEYGLDFEQALERLHDEHSDLGEDQFKRWEAYMIDKDDLALGAIIAMMDVRCARRQKLQRDA